MSAIYYILLPDVVDNTYEGSPIVPVIFGLLTVVSTIRSMIHMFKDDGGAQSVASMPLHKYSKDAADTIILLFAYWGISQRLMAITYLVILWKYRSLLPLACLLLTLEWGNRLILPSFSGKHAPTEKVAPGSIGNIVFTVLGIVLFFLSIPWGKH